MIPIRTNIRPLRTPYTNYALILANVIIFLITYSPHYSFAVGGRTEEALRAWADQFMLNPARPYLWQFVTYAFLHGSWLHLLGNMFFLYLFGNNVNDRLGHVGYLCFYLAGAVFSAAGHALVSFTPVLGASGAIAAVTGAYLVLFPQTMITVIYWFIFIIDTIDIPALYFIAFKMIILDNVISRTARSVAYDAHLTGYIFGILSILFMLGVGLVSASPFDLWSMLKRWNQRRRYKDIVSQGYDPFSVQPAKMRINVKDITEKTGNPQQAEITQFRDEISGLMAQHNFSSAADIYQKLIGIDGEQLLPRQQLLDIANQLASENKHTQAAQAYEKFLAHYHNYEYVEQVELMLGLLYSRYLNQAAPAIRHLTAAAKRLSDQGQLKMCQDELARLQN
jgi:membrane associated rhomboid family serine protease